MNIRKLGLFAAIIAGAIVLWYGGVYIYGTRMQLNELAAQTIRLDLQRLLEKQWTQQTIWTREYIIASIADAAHKPNILEKLLYAQKALAKQLVVLGRAASHRNIVSEDFDIERQRLNDIFNEHTDILVNLIAAAQTHRTDELAVASQKLQDNTRILGEYLATLNPEWSRDDLQHSLDLYTSAIVEQIIARVNQKPVEELKALDDTITEGAAIARALAWSIAKS